jgi:hypothetical protein
MNRTLIRSFAFLTVAIMGLGAGCSSGDLRGKAIKSADGATYLVVDDDNGGGCGPILVDGEVWPAAIHEPGPIEPGVHTIDCGPGGSGIEFEIFAGTTFHFDYWGP